MLFQGNSGGAPTPAEAIAYWQDIGEPDHPVLSDPMIDSIANTPYDGSPLPGKILVGPNMEILEARSGHGDDNWARDIMIAHAAGQ